MSAESDHREALARRGDMPARCGWPFAHDCSGKLRADHPIPKQTIRQRWESARIRDVYDPGLKFPTDDRVLEAGPDAMVADARNGWWLCDVAHQTGRHGPGGADFSDYLPPSVFEFADEFGFSYSPIYGWTPDSTAGVDGE